MCCVVCVHGMFMYMYVHAACVVYRCMYVCMYDIGRTDREQIRSRINNNDMYDVLNWKCSCM